MNIIDKQKIIDAIQADDLDNSSVKGYPLYESGNDIYNQSKQKDIDPETLNENIKPVKKSKADKNNESDFEEQPSGDDLDIPGAELDDEQEVIGEEDEENNYYSLGGDNHNDLDENRDY